MCQQHSVRKTAAFVGVPKSTIQNIFAGRKLSRKTIQRIAKALQIHPDRLYDLSPTKIRKAIDWKMEKSSTNDWFDDALEDPPAQLLN